MTENTEYSIKTSAVSTRMCGRYYFLKKDKRERRRKYPSSGIINSKARILQKITPIDINQEKNGHKRNLMQKAPKRDLKTMISPTSQHF